MLVLVKHRRIEALTMIALYTLVVVPTLMQASLQAQAGAINPSTPGSVAERVEGLRCQLLRHDQKTALEVRVCSETPIVLGQWRN